MYCTKGGQPFIIVEKDLCNIRGHSCQVEAALPSRIVSNVRSLCDDELSEVRIHLRLCDIDRGRSRIDAQNGNLQFGKKVGQCSCSTANVKNFPGPEPFDDVDIHVEVAPVGIKRIVDSS